MKTRLLIIPAIIISVSILVVFAYDSVNLDKLCAEKGGKRNGDICLIEIPEPLVVESDFDISKIKSIKPNSMEFFYYPNPEDTENRDVFQKFILIRLPESLGGGADDVSAFRAYSAVTLSTDHCQIKYWPEPGRQRIEDPCWGSMYRAIDGALMVNVDPILSNSPIGLPYLDLSIDENGSLYVEPPKWTLQENGVIGVGRIMSMQEIRQGSQILIDSYEKSYPNHPKIPVDFVGHVLTEINPYNSRIDVRYFDFLSTDWHNIYLEVRNVSAQDQKYFLNFAYPNSEFWQIGDSVIKISGSALDKNNDQPERFKEYEIQFILDGFKFTITGQNLESMKKAILADYFPENDYDDMFLISSTVE